MNNTIWKAGVADEDWKRQICYHEITDNLHLKGEVQFALGGPLDQFSAEEIIAACSTVNRLRLDYAVFVSKGNLSDFTKEQILQSLNSKIDSARSSVYRGIAAMPK